MKRNLNKFIKKATRGNSITEISIVLMIIAVLMLGTTFGKIVLERAKIMSFVSDLNNITSNMMFLQEIKDNEKIEEIFVNNKTSNFFGGQMRIKNNYDDLKGFWLCWAEFNEDKPTPFCEINILEKIKNLLDTECVIKKDQSGKTGWLAINIRK